MTETPHCRSCGAPIVWARTNSGKAMPVDAEPVEDGNVVLRTGPDQSVTAYVLSKRDAEGIQLDMYVSRDLYVSHFTTCPTANTWRRRRRRRR